MIYTALFAAGLATVVSAKKVSLGELPTYSFERYVQEFRHPWAEGTAEYANRKTVFESELKRVVSHNAGNVGWKTSVNKYSAMSVSEKKALNGYAKGMARVHKPRNEVDLPADFVMKPLAELPKAVDWRDKNVVTSVKDQVSKGVFQTCLHATYASRCYSLSKGHCGSCWAFASAATLESHVALNTGLLYDLSPQQIAMVRSNDYFAIHM